MSETRDVYIYTEVGQTNRFDALAGNSSKLAVESFKDTKSKY